MKNKLKIAWVWCKNNWKVLSVSFGVLLALLGIAFCSSQQFSSKIAFKKLDLSKKKEEAAKLKGKKEILELNREANEGEIRKIEDSLASIDKEIAHKRAEISKLSLKRKLDMYDDLDY